ncbi:ER to Golgi transport-related protein [Fomitiporia mediterranea MF3/22]|uniref:ER to Golgi transport-related protein n=1 Tax=Fomitiporia mediterranea (strain MF3/22) TaxID=694068 RepID=UPI0004407346|nr:ER to Golgi transport-related protein [Fomitiporia mediterranea MF3/22]EJD02849.1 ER to Golgi transport-related protein [Fomitiporia mediterranea MF3/22]
MEHLVRVTDTIKGFRETRLSALRPPTEFFDHHRLSRPQDGNQAISRISYNTRYFSGNYGVIVAILAVYALITNPLLLISIGFLVGGFAAINRFAPEPMQVGDQVITQKTLYIALFVIGIPLLWWSSPLGTFFWLVGASSFVILFHACFMEPGIESEYSAVEAGTVGV